MLVLLQVSLICPLMIRSTDMPALPTIIDNDIFLVVAVHIAEGGLGVLIILAEQAYCRCHRKV